MGAPVDLVAVRRGLDAMPMARTLVRDVDPSRVEVFARWAGREPERVDALPVALSALSVALRALPEWQGLDEEGRVSLASRVVRSIDAYRLLRDSPALDLDDVGAVLASVLQSWPTWQGLDEEGRRALSEVLNEGTAFRVANVSPGGYYGASKVAAATEGRVMPRQPARMTKQRTVRLPDALWARVDAWMTEEEGRRPGLSLNHSEALRVLLLLALEAEDKRKARKPKGGE